MDIKTEIKQYCKANGIKDVDKFINYLLRKAFYIEKYGLTPQGTSNPQVEKENEANTGDLSDSTKEDDKVVKKPRKSPSKGIKIVKNN